MHVEFRGGKGAYRRPSSSSPDLWKDPDGATYHLVEPGPLMDPRLPERAMVERAQSGERCAFDQLAEAYLERIRAVASPRVSAQLRQRIGVDDVVQETFLRAFERIGSFRWVDGKKDAFFGWLSGIALNVIRTAASEQRRQGLWALAGDVDAGSPTPSKILRRQQRFDRLEEAFSRLKPDQRLVIRLVRIDGLPVSEVARRLGKTPNAISILLLRATKRLRELFGETESTGLPDRILFAREDSEDGDGHDH